MERYLIGSKEPAPNWCRDELMCYRRMDGSVGIEFQNSCHGTVRIYELYPGDMLIQRKGYIEIKRGRGESDF